MAGTNRSLNLSLLAPPRDPILRYSQNWGRIAQLRDSIVYGNALGNNVAWTLAGPFTNVKFQTNVNDVMVTARTLPSKRVGPMWRCSETHLLDTSAFRAN